MSRGPSSYGGTSPLPPSWAEALLSRVLPGGVHGRTILGDLRQEFDELAPERTAIGLWTWYWVHAIEITARYTIERLLGRRLRPGPDGNSTMGRPSGPRETSVGEIMSQLISDFRYGIRMLVRTPMLSITAILTIALGVGLTTHMFSVVYGAVIRGPDLRDVDRLMIVNRANPVRNIANASVPYLDYMDFKGTQTSFETFETFWEQFFSLAGDELPPEQYLGGVLSAGALELTGIQPILGRAFRRGEDGPGAERLVVISAALWESRFAGDTEIIGKSIRLNSETHTVIGVMPPGFNFPSQSSLWTTHRLSAETVARGDGRLNILGHLEEGVTAEVAAAELTALHQRLKTEFPETNGEWDPVILSFVDRFMPAEITAILLLMLGAVFGVLLIACANVANLLMARASLRGREVAVRTALGASRLRIMRQLLAESIVLGLIGGTLGLVLSYGGVELFNAAILNIRKPYWIDIKIDKVALAFTLLVTLIAAVAAGTLPALRASGEGVGAILKDEGRGSTSRRLGRFTQALVVAEVAVSCGLMIASGLMIKSVATLRTLDMGFEDQGLLTASLNLTSADYPERSDRDQFFLELIRRLEAEPDVRAAALTTFLPGTGAARWAFGKEEETYTTNSDFTQVHGSIASSGFLETFGIPLLQGRRFRASEDGMESEAVAMVSRSFAERFYPDGDAIGRRIRIGRLDSPFPWMEIVGVVGDVHTGSTNPGGLGSAAITPEHIYGSRSLFESGLTIGISTVGAPEGFAPRARAVVAEMDPNLPLRNVRTMKQAIGDTNWAFGLFGSLFTIFGAVALFLAAVGLYGVLAFSVARRKQEMGIRMALGAGGRDIIRLVLRSGLTQLGLGVALGVGLGVGLSQPLRIALFGVDTTDPTVYAAVVGTLLLTGLTATLIPALRATRMDPNEALRED